jgi:hypothetical protein
LTDDEYHNILREVVKAGYPAICPACGVDMIGDPIPEIHQHRYSFPYYLTSEATLGDDDRICAWKCLNCNHEWRGR